MKRLFRDVFKKNKGIIFISCAFLFVNLINITLLPIFNDESIYLDWGWSFTHIPGHLYDSLLDAKQPLLIWIFAIAENFFADPLFAGRFISIIFGGLTLLGIFVVSRKIFTTQIAYFSVVLFSIIPIFAFYNRQALMESAITCVGIWSCYALLELLQKPSLKNGALLGFVLGVGFFIKTSAILFILSSVVCISFFAWRERNIKLAKSYAFSFLVFMCVNFLLFMSPIFWQTLSSNSRYSYSPLELLSFPIVPLAKNFLGFLEIGFIFVTPLIFLASVLGTIKIFQEKSREKKIFIIYFGISLFLEVLSVKVQSQRYLVPFLVFLVIPASYFLYRMWEKGFYWKITTIVSCAIPFLLFILVIFSPERYILELSKVSQHAETGYIFGQTSGYGIREVMEYIKANSSTQKPTQVFIAMNAGNPENAVDLYSQRYAYLYALHIRSDFFLNLDQYECLSSDYPVFFVTRNNELAGMDKYFSLRKSFLNPNKTYSIGIYTLKKNCSGKTLSLSKSYQPAMERIQQLRSATGGILNNVVRRM